MIANSLDAYFYPILVVGLLLFSAFTVIFHRYTGFLNRKKIQSKHPNFTSQLRDAALSLIAPVFFLPSAWLCSYLSQNNMGFIYHDIDQYGLAYLVFSLFLVTLVHDTYYYWVHRLLHTRFLFKKIHAVHHASRNPTVVTFFAMHPLEDVLMSLSIPLCAFLFPMNDVAFECAYFLYLAQAIYAHSGFEWFKTQKPSSFFNTSYAHNLHHQYTKVNYSYFYNIWDRIGGTLCPYPASDTHHNQSS